jgi:pyruvate kinase
MFRGTKIVATIGPASTDFDILVKMINAGVDVVRLNFSHGKAQDHIDRAALVRRAAAECGREVAIMADMQGPKIRVGKFEQGKIFLENGDKFILDAKWGENGELGNQERVGPGLQGIAARRAPGRQAAAQRRPDRADGRQASSAAKSSPPSRSAASCRTTRASTARAAA